MNTEQLIDALKRVLKSRRITYADLAARIGLSEASVKRLFSQRTFTLSRLQQILAALEIDFRTAKLARGAGDAPQEMSEAQEQALASEPHLMGVFYLLFNDWQPSQVLARYELTEVELTKILTRLDRLQLIDLLPGNRVKLRVSRHLRRPGGAIRPPWTTGEAEFAVGDSTGTAELPLRPAFHGLDRRRAAQLDRRRSSTNWRNSTAHPRRTSGNRQARARHAPRRMVR
jgi:transcriptional regulator with XRE-family HTH domain